MPELQPALYDYFEANGACGRDLLKVVAVSLGLAEDFFAPRYAKPLQRTQILYYPPQDPQADELQFGVAPHTDYGCITLLWQDHNGGLQARERATRSWIEAPPIPGTFGINFRRPPARCTNDHLCS